MTNVALRDAGCPRCFKSNLKLTKLVRCPPEHGHQRFKCGSCGAVGWVGYSKPQNRLVTSLFPS